MAIPALDCCQSVPRPGQDADPHGNPSHSAPLLRKRKKRKKANRRFTLRRGKRGDELTPVPTGGSVIAVESIN
jgi:hypothetical protein